MREVTLREESDRCTLVVNLTINTEDVEAVVDSGAQVSVLSKGVFKEGVQGVHGVQDPPKFSDFFLKSEGKGVERKRKKIRRDGGGG